ncbi:MAG: type III-A CRISPR-associated protein Csm2 [Halanaerobiales bacterium]|nr:type III-A CRISPR-associated protein Csm2 [Halanaerobiales bacterium]
MKDNFVTGVVKKASFRNKEGIIEFKFNNTKWTKKAKFARRDCFNDIPQVGEPVKCKVYKNSNEYVAKNITTCWLSDYFKKTTLNPQANDYDTYYDNVQYYAEQLSNADLSMSQIRKVYSSVMKAESIKEVKMLRPQFAYASGRSNYIGVKNLMALLDFLVKAVENEKQHLKNLQSFLEALVAYLKYVGAKD